MQISSSTVVLGFGIAASLLSNSLLGSRIGEVSRQRELEITPRNAAFGIWIFIYGVLLVTFVYGLYEPISLPMACCLAGALIFCAAWVPLFSQNTKTTLGLSSFVLLIAFAASFAAVLMKARLDFSNPLRAISLQISPAIFSGWLAVASTLNFGIFLKSFEVTTKRWVLLLLASILSFLAAIAKNGVLLAPFLWAIFLQKEATIWSFLSGLVAFLGIGATTQAF